MLSLLRRLYDWQYASRRWALSRPFFVLLCFGMPAFASATLFYLVKHYRFVRPEIALPIIDAGLLLSVVGLLSWILYTAIRASWEMWRAIRGKPIESEWREP